jgi:hypothetical protein
LKNVKESIYCQTSIKYLQHIERAARKNIQIYLVVMADGDEFDERFKRLSQMRNVEINVIEKNQMLTSIEMNKNRKS